MPTAYGRLLYFAASSPSVFNGTHHGHAQTLADDGGRGVQRSGIKEEAAGQETAAELNGEPSFV